MSAQRLVLVVAILVGIGTLIALPDLLDRTAGEEIRVVEVSERIGKDRVSVSGDEGGSESREREAQGDQSDRQPASSGGGSGGRHTDDTAPGASVSAPRSASLGSSASAAPSNGGGGSAVTGGSGEVASDQPAPVSPLPEQPPSSSSSDVDDDVEVEEPEDEAGD